MTENEKIELFDKWYDENYDEWAEGEEGIVLREELEQAFKSGIAELEKENAELKQAEKDKVVEHFEAYGQCRDSRRIAELEAQIERMKVKWHDLEKDPNDLPKDYKTMCICLSNFGSKYEPVPQVCVGYCDSLGWSDYMGSSLYSTVRYWCEIPLFKEIKEK